MKTRLMIAAILGLASGVPSEAGTITYTYSTELHAVIGDISGLNAATVTVNATFSSTDVYFNNGYGTPLVVADLGATYTISGSSVMANNGTFDFPTAIVYDPYAASLLASGASYTNPVVTLSGGWNLEMNLSTVATAQGANVIIGDPISPLDFAPTISQYDSWSAPNSEEAYEQIYSTVSVNETLSVPEPSSLVLLGVAGVAGLLFARSRRRRHGIN